MQERRRPFTDDRIRRSSTRRRWCLFVALVATLLGGCSGLHNIRRHVAGTVDVPVRGGACTRTYHYLAYTPPDYDAPEMAGHRWPLLLYLPGTLSVGTDVRRLAKDDPPGEIELGRDFPMVVVTPMTPAWLERWTPHLVITLIDTMLERYRCDPDRVYISGVSISGWGVWDAAIAYPDRIAAAVPVCGWGSPQGIERMIDVPVWAFHGGLDFAVPLPFHYRMIEAMRKAGGDPRWTVIPLGFHWIWKPVYKMPELYAWMLEQRVSNRTRPRETQGNRWTTPCDPPRPPLPAPPTLPVSVRPPPRSGVLSR